MTMREHLQKVHTHSAEFHLAKAKAYRGLAKCFGMAKAEMDRTDDADPENISSVLDDLAEQEDEMSAFHLECCDGLAKAATDDLTKADLDRIAPDRVSAILPDVPSSIRAIPRAGQREVFGKATDGIDANLIKVIGLEEMQ
jgi:hypothetical protein